MRYKLLAFILALTVASWAQTTTPTQAPDTGKTTKAQGGGCCAKMAADHADHKDGHSCMKHTASAKDDKESCCAGKDAKACAKDDKTSAGCCASECGKNKEKEMGACAGTDGKLGCCGGGQSTHDHAAPGN